MEFIHITILAIIFLTTYFMGRTLSASIFHPIRIFSIIWCVFVIVPTIFWDKGYSWTFSGFYWIAAAAFFMTLGGMMAKRCFTANHLPVRGGIETTDRKDDLSGWWFWLYVILGVGVLHVVMYLITKNISLSSLTSFEKLIVINEAAAWERYYGSGSSTTMLNQILLTGVYAGNACGGYVFNFAKNKRQKALALLVLLPIVATMLLENTKAGFIASVFLWFSGWCVSRLRIYGHLPVIRWSLLWKLLLLGAAFILVLYFVMLLRVGDFSAGMRTVIYNKLLFYAFGQMVQFDGWFHGEAQLFAQGLGTNTYMWLPHLLGITERAHGVYQTYVIEQGGNIFTAFRGVLEDFGIIFGLFYMMLRGFILEYACCRVTQAKTNRMLSCTLVLCGYMFILYGFIISPWIYTSYSLAMLGFLVFTFLFHSRIRIRL